MRWEAIQKQQTIFLLRGVTMPSRHEVTCINKSDRLNPHERIVSIGGRNADGKMWKLSQAGGHPGIENGTWSFFVRRFGQWST